MIRVWRAAPYDHNYIGGGEIIADVTVDTRVDRGVVRVEGVGRYYTADHLVLHVCVYDGMTEDDARFLAEQGCVYGAAKWIAGIAAWLR